MPSNKTFRVKRVLGKKTKQNRQMPAWFRAKGTVKRAYSFKRRNWRHSKIGL
ncbi:60S ribosomal protein L39 [Coemansia javaensis]|uniref:Large ribosomal subunit protein eL39 n=1 Tax=Coemansia javaensis TaxID=2761396 RepID=A0A9W8HAD1_9FUNG|nr:60S ribosomal protein L39 [Coemansia javaensis]